MAHLQRSASPALCLNLSGRDSAARQLQTLTRFRQADAHRTSRKQIRRVAAQHEPSCLRSPDATATRHIAEEILAVSSCLMRRATLLAAAAFALSAAPAASAESMRGAGLRGLLSPSAEPAPAARPATRRTEHAGPRVQFGIFSSQAIAAERWGELRRRYRKQLAGRSLSVERQVVRGNVGYVSAIRGFQSRSGALSFCRRMRREGWDCIVRF